MWEMTVGTTEAPPLPARRARLKGTPQQEDFWAQLCRGSGSVLLEARAGTGKSTSCREGMWRLLEADPSLAIRYCCFNRKIAEEFRARCPLGVEVGTMHSFALWALGRAFGSKIDAQKSYTVLDQIEHGKDLKRYLRKSVATLVGLAKNQGLHPDDPALKARLSELVWTYDVETWRRQGEIVDWAVEVLRRSAELTAIVDFDDMLWLAVLHQVRFPSVDFLFIDECQDLNPLQHELAALMCPDGRLVAVGDPFQSIYAFRGADSESINKLRDRFGLFAMPLTVTFRCPRSHVELARRLVPDFEAAAEAPEGELAEADEDAIEQAQPGDLVLCRANAPIVSACLRAIARRQRAVVRGRAIGDQLGAALRKVGEYPTIPALLRGIALWRTKELEILDARDGSEPAIEALNDKADCLAAIAGTCASPAAVPGVIAQLFADDDSATRVTFSSVHRAKGSEARNVLYIQVPYGEKRDRERPPQQWELDQRRNLRYVALTRSLHSLTLITPTRKGA